MQQLRSNRSFSSNDGKGMNQQQEAPRKSVAQAIRWSIFLVGTMLAMSVSFMPQAKAQSNDADKILKAMSDYVASQKTLSVTFDSDIEVITPNLQKIQFASSGRVQLSRPDKLRVARTGGYTAVEIVFDGKMLTVNNKDHNDFAQVESSGSIDQLIDLLREKHRITAPGADLLLSQVFDVMMADVIDAEHICQGIIDGVEGEHLAFRNLDTDWQIRIEAGAPPIPRKYVITSKAVTGAPQYTLRIKKWKTELPADIFAFNPPQGATKIDWSGSWTSTAGNDSSRRKEMNLTPATLIRLSIASVVGSAALFLSAEVPLDSRSSLVSSAEARVGRPLTPMSYAGVARRTTRRAVAYGAAAGAAAGVAVGAAAYAAPGCVQTQVADAYGRIVTVCQ
jgi:hypothetical protein